MFAFAAADLDSTGRFALDQDTGGAIRAEADVMFIWVLATMLVNLAGKTTAKGDFYYLFIKPDNDRMKVQ